MNAPATRLPRLPFVLLGLMTAFTFGGPVAIGYVLRGGVRASWHPDRPVEWFVFVAVSGMVFLLMMACLSLTLVNRKAIKPRAAPPLPLGEGPGVRVVASPVGAGIGSDVDHSTRPDPHPGPLPGGEGGRGTGPLLGDVGGRRNDPHAWTGVEP